MSYTHLSHQDRYVISHLRGRVSLREIGRRIGRLIQQSGLIHWMKHGNGCIVLCSGTTFSIIIVR